MLATRSQPEKRDPLGHLTTAANVFRLTMLFVLFTMLFVRSMPHSYHEPHVELAKSMTAEKKPQAQREDAILFVIQRDGWIYLSNEIVGHDRDQIVSHEEVTHKISVALKSGAEKRVYIKADARVRYRMVKDVLDQIRDSGIEHVTFIVEQVKPKGPVEEFYNILKP
jgi:biopolymer transport protein ExbD